MSTLRVADKILVLGGNGFLGSQVCRRAVQHGMKVVSLSRSGQPDHLAEQPWAKEVNWLKGNALEPGTYKNILPSCFALVHAIGAVFEWDYKWILRGRWPTSTSPKQTINQANFETLKISLDESEISDVQTYVYISATDPLPFVDSNYISSKRAAEKEVLDIHSIRGVVLRPSLIYSEQRPLTLALALPANVANTLRLVSHRPLPVETVAEAAVQAVLNPAARGVFEVEQIQNLALQANPVP